MNLFVRLPSKFGLWFIGTFFVCFLMLTGAEKGLALPDLVISGIPKLTPTSVQAGKTVTVGAVTVKNSGTVSTGKVSYLGYYLSSDSIITRGDTRLGISATIPTLAGGASKTVSIKTLKIPSDQAERTYYIGVLADRMKGVTESNEGNNYRSTPITAWLLLPILDQAV